MIFNALTYKVPKAKCDGYNLVESLPGGGGNCSGFLLVDGAHTDVSSPNLYLFDLRAPDAVIDKVIERVFENGSRLLVRTASDLNEVGYFDARCRLSPIMLLHKLGLLERAAAVVGGVALDRDDADLMAQCGCPLILTPSYDMGRGHGIPDVVMYLRRGVKIALGTEDCSYNKKGDVKEEARLLKLTSSALMHLKDAVTDKQIDEMLARKIF